jgi:hypothetical protein
MFSATRKAHTNFYLTNYNKVGTALDISPSQAAHDSRETYGRAMPSSSLMFVSCFLKVGLMFCEDLVMDRLGNVKAGGCDCIIKVTLRRGAIARPPLWSSGRSSWLQNGDVLCFL